MNAPGKFPTKSERIAELERKLSTAQSAIESLLEYAHHSPTCPMPANKCDCGLEELMKKLDPTHINPAD